MDVSLKIEHAHTESSELRLHKLARLHVHVEARWSRICSLIGQQEVALKMKSLLKLVQIQDVSLLFFLKYLCVFLSLVIDGNFII